jgi:hypothetical protein
MAGSDPSSNPPSLRTTRSRINPTVTLYSLNSQNILIEAEPRMQERPEETSVVKEGGGASGEESTRSRFFGGSTSGSRQDHPDINEKRKRSGIATNSPQLEKRRKLDDKDDVNGVRLEPASPASSTSTLSPPPRIAGQSVPAFNNVKAEPPATPLRRITRNQASCTLVDPKMESTPMRTVKHEEPTSVRKTPKIKGESSAKPRPSTPIKLKLDKPHPEPPRWRRQYELIEKMREKIVAPVDTL